jgi:hypothetical protein
MGSTRSHPLPPGIFVEMSPTDEELIEEIKRLRERIKELESKKATPDEKNEEEKVRVTRGIDKLCDHFC